MASFDFRGLPCRGYGSHCVIVTDASKSLPIALSRRHFSILALLGDIESPPLLLTDPHALIARNDCLDLCPGRLMCRYADRMEPLGLF